MSFDPDKDIPDLAGKTFLITGGTNGLGRETLYALAKHSPKAIYFTGRNAASADAIIETARASAPSVTFGFIPCDQLSLASVAAAARAFLAASPDRLDVLICNAGVMATAAGLSADGYENQFAVNHVAHALLVKLLLPALEKTAGARVLFLTSLGFMHAFPNGGIQLGAVKTAQDYGPGAQWARYGQSKLANVVYARALARRRPALTALALHPGVVATDLVARLQPEEKALVHENAEKLLEAHEGAYNTLWCATVDADRLQNGQLYLPVGEPGQHSKDSADPALADKLWAWTQEELKVYG